MLAILITNGSAKSRNRAAEAYYRVTRLQPFAGHRVFAERRRCDEAASEVAADKSQRADPDRQVRRQQIFDNFSAEYPEVIDHKHAKLIVRSGVAAHHAGHIPSWKLLIEKMMSAGLLNALFATSTVAAGVDFPARTVVITNADTRGNEGWRALTASELQQMTGRAAGTDAITWDL